MTRQTFDRLIALGFDATMFHRLANARPKCSQCEALVINNVPCHETGCTNARHKCHGCDDLIPVRDRFCEDCRS